MARSNSCGVRKDDVVVSIAGRDKGRKGKVLQVFPEANRALVEGINLIKKHMKPSKDNPEGGIVEKEAPIHVSNLRVDSSSAKSK
jgi:large subunit ribosomal protein L24